MKQGGHHRLRSKVKMISQVGVRMGRILLGEDRPLILCCCSTASQACLFKKILFNFNWRLIDL